MPVQQIFSALADPTRFAIVERLLAQGDKTAGDLAEPYNISKPAISRHLKILEDAGVIERRVDRQFRVFRARQESFAEIEDWLEQARQFWTGSFKRLEKLFDQDGDGNGR